MKTPKLTISAVTFLNIGQKYLHLYVAKLELWYNTRFNGDIL
jgi:hypothetical protein